MALSLPLAKYFTSADGTSIYADAQGNPSKPAIVLIHGFSLSSSSFDGLLEDDQLTENLYIIRYDVRGHGRSGMPTAEDAWESKRLCEDFDAVVQGFKLHKPFVLGWSMGGTHITDVLSFHPHSYISGIIYVSAIPFMGPIVAEVTTSSILALVPSLLQTTDVEAFQKVALGFISLCSTTLPFAARQALLGDVMTQPRHIAASVMTRTQDTAGLFKAGRSGLPLLALNAKLDQVVHGAKSVEAIAGWKNLQVVELEKADHVAWLTQPNEFRESLLTWIREQDNIAGDVQTYQLASL
ncbi:hypothetical protein HGRIS_010903 [Hohenbuehelia grisea]|uniref:AB hydrolase-1 domain-containing protein n=1 Tax=Hohenbuehelia grisea TaxID=104357 RepID=A0ABR3IYL7_9AGAR